MASTSLFTSPFGEPVPDRDHALTVSLPKWDYFQAIRDEDMSVLQHFKTDYPRFFIHPSVRKVRVLYGIELFLGLANYQIVSELLRKRIHFLTRRACFSCPF